MGKGSSGTKTTYTSSPEQRQIFAALLPMLQQLGAYGANQASQSNLGAPNAPKMPSMQGVMSGVPMYQTYGYDIPDTSSIMPTTDWWNSLSSDVKAGAWKPFAEGQSQLMETLGGSGVSGSARGGYSGAAGAALGQYMADATPAYAMNLWNMSSPGMMAGWQGQLGRNQYMAGLENQRAQWGYQNQLTERQTDYSNEMARLGSDYDMQRQAWGVPFGITGMVPSTFSQGITTQPQSTNWAGMLSSGILGGMGGYSAMGNSGWGGLLGGLGGFLGGK